jgi:hypothetical protein
MGRNSVTIFDEVGSGYHLVVAQLAEVCIILDLFGIDITGIDDTGDVLHLNFIEEMCFTNTVLTKVHVFSTFIGDRVGPRYTRVIIFVYRDALRAVRHMYM